MQRLAVGPPGPNDDARAWIETVFFGFAERALRVCSAQRTKTSDEPVLTAGRHPGGQTERRPDGAEAAFVQRPEGGRLPKAARDEAGGQAADARRDLPLGISLRQRQVDQRLCATRRLCLREPRRYRGRR